MTATIQKIEKPIRARAWDTSGNNNHGQIYSGRALEFDGVTDYIVTTDPFNYTPITISCWVNTADDGDSKTIFSNRKNGTTKGAMLYVDANEEIVFKVENVNTTAIAITAGRWYHIVATYSGTVQKVFINGVLTQTESRTETALDTDTNAMIGGDSLPASGSQYFFNGRVSEVAIYSSDLSVSQVRTLYNSREPYNHKEGVANRHLEAWYRMGDLQERTSGTIYDMSNNSNNGTKYNSPNSNFQGDTP